MCTNLDLYYTPIKLCNIKCFETLHLDYVADPKVHANRYVERLDNHSNDLAK